MVTISSLVALVGGPSGLTAFVGARQCRAPTTAVPLQRNAVPLQPLRGRSRRAGHEEIGGSGAPAQPPRGPPHALPEVQRRRPRPRPRPAAGPTRRDGGGPG